MINEKKVEVRQTEDRGLGLFAKQNFKKGEKVMDWNIDNKFLSQEEVANLSEDLKRYVAVFREKYLLIPEPERYMNHSCDPNTEVLKDGIDVALRDIKAGEEITGDYTKEGTLIGFTCLCGSANCKKVIENS